MTPPSPASSPLSFPPFPSPVPHLPPAQRGHGQHCQQLRPHADADGGRGAEDEEAEGVQYWRNGVAVRLQDGEGGVKEGWTDRTDSPRVSAGPRASIRSSQGKGWEGAAKEGACVLFHTPTTALCCSPRSHYEPASPTPHPHTFTSPLILTLNSLHLIPHTFRLVVV